jgi:hypothetical protein
MSEKSTGKLIAGIVLLVSFAAVMFVIFMPIFEGGNALNYLDNLYNSISKGSAYYIVKMEHLVDEHPTEDVSLTLVMEDAAAANRAASVLTTNGISAKTNGDNIAVLGDLNSILDACLEDAETAYHNRGDDLTAKYGMDPRASLHSWWGVLKAMEKDLNRQKRFAAAHLVHAIQTKAVECSYNYYGIAPSKIGDRWGTVLFSLVFYVIYTIWYGYAIMFLFEGLGFKLAH